MKSFVIALLVFCISAPVIGIDNLPDKVDRAMPSVVIVKNEPGPMVFNGKFNFSDLLNNSNIHSTSFGTGFFIEKNLIVTNYHVIEGKDRIISIRLSEHDKRKFVAEVVGYDKFADVALLKVTVSGRPLKFSEKPLRRGEGVFTIGHPRLYYYGVSHGIVAHENRRDYLYPEIQYIHTDAAVNGGNSGGPLFNRFGEVIGINTKIITNTGSFAGMSLSLSNRTVLRSVRKIKKQGVVTRPMLDFLIRPTPKNKVHILMALTKSPSVRVSSVKENSRLRKNDIILTVNGLEIPNMRFLLDYIHDFYPGDVITFTVFRNNTKIIINTALLEQSEKITI